MVYPLRGHIKKIFYPTPEPSFMGALSVFQENVKEVKGCFKCFKDVSCVFNRYLNGCFIDASRMFQR